MRPSSACSLWADPSSADWPDTGKPASQIMNIPFMRPIFKLRFINTTAVRCRSTIKMPGCEWCKKLKSPRASGPRGKNQESTSEKTQAPRFVDGRWLFKSFGTNKSLHLRFDIWKNRCIYSYWLLKCPSTRLSGIRHFGYQDFERPNNALKGHPVFRISTCCIQIKVFLVHS